MINKLAANMYSMFQGMNIDGKTTSVHKFQEKARLKTIVKLNRSMNNLRRPLGNKINLVSRNDASSNIVSTAS